MGNCYSIGRIAEYQVHKNITFSIEKPQQKYHLGTAGNRLLGGGGGP